MKDEKITDLAAYVRALKAGESMDVVIEDDAPLTLERWSDVEKWESPQDPWLVNHLIPREGITILASISGSGKSFLTMHLAKCIAEGAPLFGYSDLYVRQARVLYINLEMAKSEFKRRGERLGMYEHENLLFINALDDFNLNRADDEDTKYKQLMTLIYEADIQVVIVDTFRAAAGGLKEDKAEEVRAFFQKFLILKNSGVSVVFTEHLRKPTHLEGKKPKKEQLLGSQDKTANVEVLLMIAKDESSGDIQVYQRKNRIAPEIQPFSVRMTDTKDSSGREMISFEYLGNVDDEATKKDEGKGLILNLLVGGAHMTRKEIVQQIGRQVGDKNIRAALGELTASGEIDFVKRGKAHLFFTTPIGETGENSSKNGTLNNLGDYFDTS